MDASPQEITNLKEASHLMESTTDVQSPLLLASSSDGCWGDGLALVQEPGCRSTRAVAVKLVGTLFRLLKPVGESPGLGFLLQSRPKIRDIATSRVSKAYLFIALLVLGISIVTGTEESDTSKETTADLRGCEIEWGSVEEKV